MRFKSGLVWATLVLGTVAFGAAARTTTVVISGRIVDQTGQGIARAVVSGNNGAATAITAPDGSYTISVPPRWNGRVTPQQAGLTFDPPNRSYSLLTETQKNQNFTAIHPPVSISGRVVTPDGRAIAGVVVQANGTSRTAGKDTEAVSDKAGRYRLNLIYHWSGKIAPHHPLYSFEPALTEREDLATGEEGRDFVGKPSNAKPVAEPQTAATDEDTPITLTLAGADPDGQDISFRVATQPQHGRLGSPTPVASQPVRAARVVYSPARHYHGPDAFTFIPNDGTQDGVPATVMLTVRPVNNPPTAKPMEVVVPVGESRPITLTAQDPDGDKLTYEIVVPPRYGVLGGTPPNVTYTPQADWEQSVPAETIFVDPTLSTSETGQYDPQTRSRSRGTYQAFRTIKGAADAAQPGQTVILREGSYREPLAPARSGEPDRPIIFSNFSVRDRFAYKASDGKLDSGPVTVTVRMGEEAVITGADLDPGVDLIDRNWIILDGLKIDQVQRWLHAVRANHNVIRNCVFSKALNTSGSAKTGLFFQDGSFNRITGNTITESGSDNLALVHADRNVVEGNHITLAGHTLWTLKCGNCNVLRNNYFHNKIQKIGEIYDCDNVGFDHEYFIYDSTKHNLVEGNTFALTASSGDHSPFCGIQYAGQNGIIRNNLFYETTGPALDLTHYAPEALYTTHNRVFHNVFYATHFAGLTISSSQDKPLVDNLIVNNVFLQSIFVANDTRWAWYRKELAGKPVQVMVSGLNGFVLENNCLFNQKAGEEYLITCGSRQASKNPPPQPLAWWQNKHPELFHGNMEVDPGFIDATGHDFGLKPDSPLIDAGAFLTTAVGTGEGTCLPIKDTGWFYDGFGIPGERGDLIQLEGQTEPAHIVSIDNATSTLRLDRLLKWTDGQGIARRYFGSRPDVGAVESLPGGNEPPVAGVSATPATDNPLAVLLDGSSSSDADGRIASYDWDFGDGQRVENGPATLSHAFARSGRFTVTLKVTDNGRPSQSAYACLAVRVGTPKLVVEPTACNLDFQATTARIVIRNLGEGTLRCKLSPSEQWIATSRPAGICEGQPEEVTITANPQGLPPGDHKATLRIEAGPAGSQEVPITLAVPTLRDTPLIRVGDVWRYFKGTTTPPTTWNQLAFDDSAWPSGPTGIGYSDDVKYATVLNDMRLNYVTFYARRKFTLADAKTVFKMNLGMVYDDGFIAYINGTEVARSPGVTSPGKQLTYQDVSASRHKEDQPEKVFPLAIPLSLLNSGENVLAIEVHNLDTHSSSACMVPQLAATVIVRP